MIVSPKRGAGGILGTVKAYSPRMGCINLSWSYQWEYDKVDIFGSVPEVKKYSTSQSP